MKAQPTTKQLIEMLYERLPELFDRAAAQPAPVQEPVFTYDQVKAHIQAAMMSAAQPAVPDAIHHTDTSETLDYIQGWNDCRAEMLKGSHEPV
jgi:hypothetical protein